MYPSVRVIICYRVWGYCAGRWPDHPEAFLKVKAAMGCQLADELASGFGLRAAASQHCVDVLSDGYAFRLFLCSDR